MRCFRSPSSFAVFPTDMRNANSVLCTHSAGSPIAPRATSGSLTLVVTKSFTSAKLVNPIKVNRTILRLRMKLRSCSTTAGGMTSLARESCRACTMHLPKKTRIPSLSVPA